MPLVFLSNLSQENNYEVPEQLGQIIHHFRQMKTTNYDEAIEYQHFIVRIAPKESRTLVRQYRDLNFVAVILKARTMH